MNKVLTFPLVRIIIAVAFVGAGLLIGQTVLSLIRSSFSLTNTFLANLLALCLIVPPTYLAYRIYVRTIEKRILAELDSSNALPEFGAGVLVGAVLFALVILVLGLWAFTGQWLQFRLAAGARYSARRLRQCLRTGVDLPRHYLPHHREIPRHLVGARHLRRPSSNSSI